MSSVSSWIYRGWKPLARTCSLPVQDLSSADVIMQPPTLKVRWFLWIFLTECNMTGHLEWSCVCKVDASGWSSVDHSRLLHWSIIDNVVSGYVIWVPATKNFTYKNLFVLNLQCPASKISWVVVQLGHENLMTTDRQQCLTSNSKKQSKGEWAGKEKTHVPAEKWLKFECIVSSWYYATFLYTTLSQK